MMVGEMIMMLWVGTGRGKGWVACNAMENSCGGRASVDFSALATRTHTRAHAFVLCRRARFHAVLFGHVLAGRGVAVAAVHQYVGGMREVVAR